jgi:hypothetical protein
MPINFLLVHISLDTVHALIGFIDPPEVLVLDCLVVLSCDELVAKFLSALLEVFGDQLLGLRDVF